MNDLTDEQRASLELPVQGTYDVDPDPFPWRLAIDAWLFCIAVGIIAGVFVVVALR